MSDSSFTYAEMVDLKRTLDANYQPRVPVFESEFAIEAVPRKMGRWGRARAWLEDRVALAGMVWPWPRVLRTVAEPRIYAVAGMGWVAHPSIVRRMKELETR